MRYIIRHFETIPIRRLVVFAKSDNAEELKMLDFQATQIIDTQTGEIISDFGQRSPEYDSGWVKPPIKKIKK